jgi:hypothetical protein
MYLDVKIGLEICPGTEVVLVTESGSPEPLEQLEAQA